MLIKITLILLVISIALYIITRVYFNTLSASNKDNAKAEKEIKERKMDE